jgi:hypothetical protein
MYCFVGVSKVNFLEKQVNKDTPTTFLWQTATDDVVPVENSYLYVEACKKNGVAVTV